ncbi:MAG: hypothetical protein V7635_1847, partial [Arthrobacter sp.]
RATELGMVASTGKGQIDLSTLSVTGNAKPAVKGDAAGAVIAAPAVAGQLTVVPPAAANEPLAKRKLAESGAESVPAAAAAVEAAAEAVPPAAAAVVPAAPAVELYGGSVPAPAQKVPGQ